MAIDDAGQNLYWIDLTGDVQRYEVDKGAPVCPQHVCNFTNSDGTCTFDESRCSADCPDLSTSSCDGETCTVVLGFSATFDCLSGVCNVSCKGTCTVHAHSTTFVHCPSSSTVTGCNSSGGIMECFGNGVVNCD
jgi:hypothetical protein